MADAARALAPVVGLDDIAADPSHVEALSQGELATMLLRALSVVGTLQARVTRHAVMDAAHLRTRLTVLSTADVAQRLGRSVSWVERHMGMLPPRRSFAGMPGWLESELNDWMRAAPRYVPPERTDQG